MPESIKKPFVEFANRHGIGAAIAVVLLVWMMHTTDEREKAARIERSEAIAGLKLQVATIGQKIDSQGENLGEIKADLRGMTVTIADHERRLTRREDNQFTAQDGQKVEMQVVENSAILVRHTEALAEIKQGFSRLERAVAELTAAVEGQQ
ncbi:MAG: hypothetical protein AAGJ46_21560 [Planctomycetota bacterium]